jgi:hypothetical protein
VRTRLEVPRVRRRVSPSKAFKTTPPTCNEQSYLWDSHSCSVPSRQVLHSKSVGKLKPVQKRCKVRHETKAKL